VVRTDMDARVSCGGFEALCVLPVDESPEDKERRSRVIIRQAENIGASNRTFRSEARAGLKAGAEARAAAAFAPAGRPNPILLAARPWISPRDRAIPASQ
jgi:hypothetical protein